MGRKKAQESQAFKTKLIMKGNPLGYFKNQTKIDFVASKKTNLYKKTFRQPIFPIFNTDDKFFTPGFILSLVESPTQQDYYENHLHKVEQSLYEIDQSQILFPKPRSKNKYCGVCRQTHEDYLEHIRSKQHQGKLQKNNFQQFIKNLCIQYLKKYHNDNDREYDQIQKSISIETKMNQDQNSTESIIQNNVNNVSSINNYSMNINVDNVVNKVYEQQNKDNKQNQQQKQQKKQQKMQQQKQQDYKSIHLIL